MTEDRMSPERETKTLGDLLLALERSSNLRSLARECGMAPGDLKRNLKRWRKELGTEGGEETEAKPASSKAGSVPEDLEGLVAAKSLDRDDMKNTPELTAWTDGASRGNPGPASVGVLFGTADGEPLAAHAENIGKATNNVAEYQAVLRAVEFAVKWKTRKLRLNLDSELVARQLTGQYRVKSPDLIPFYRQIVSLAHELEVFQVRHVRREKNTLADALANLALDGQGGRFGA
jgi:ribonuclease HI